MNFKKILDKTWGKDSNPGKRALFIFGLVLVYATVMVLLAEYIPRTSNSEYVNTDSLQYEADQYLVQEQDKEMISRLELVHGIDHINIEQGVNGIVGVTGIVDWRCNSFPEEYKDNPDVFTVECDAQGNPAGKKKTFTMRMVVNRKTGQFEILEAKEDGKLLDGPVLMLALLIAGGYSSEVSF